MNQAPPASTLSASGAEIAREMLCLVTQSVVRRPAVPGSFRNADSRALPQTNCIGTCILTEVPRDPIPCSFRSTDL